jgi:hypothetical protein
MQCSTIKLGNGVTAIACGSRRKQKRDLCTCGQPGSQLCDFPSSKESGTCDKAVCLACALHLPLERDSQDFCTNHKQFVFYQDDLRIYVINNKTLQRGELIDRQTVLGNPFTLDGMSDTPKSRQIVIDRYRRALWRKLHVPDDPVTLEVLRLVEQLRQTKQLLLRCWCMPKDCHGQSLAKAILYVMNNELPKQQQ